MWKATFPSQSININPILHLQKKCGRPKKKLDPPPKKKNNFTLPPE